MHGQPPDFMIDQKPKSRNIALECLRGGAALAVVFGHCAVAFGLPIWQLPQIAQLPFNGSSAVEFFFVLSGYVLTRAFVTNENWIGLLRSAAKRYFRLLGPVLLATLVSLLLFDLHAYRYEQLSKSGQFTMVVLLWQCIPARCRMDTICRRRPMAWRCPRVLRARQPIL